jgi:hypothetical protein
VAQDRDQLQAIVETVTNKLCVVSEHIQEILASTEISIEICMNQIQKFIISTADLVLTFIPQLKSSQLFKKNPFILEPKFLITLLLASQMHLMT